MKIKNNIKSPKKFDLEELIQFLANQLNINEDVELSIIYNDKLLEKLSKDVEFQALLSNPIPHKYVLMVKEDVSELQYIICHEMVHLKQCESDRLKMSSDFKTVIWDGEVFDNTSDYFEREGEKEARSKEDRLGKLFKKTLTNK